MGPFFESGPIKKLHTPYVRRLKVVPISSII